MNKIDDILGPNERNFPLNPKIFYSTKLVTERSSEGKKKCDELSTYFFFKSIASSLLIFIVTFFIYSVMLTSIAPKFHHMYSKINMKIFTYKVCSTCTCIHNWVPVKVIAAVRVRLDAKCAQDIFKDILYQKCLLRVPVCGTETFKNLSKIFLCNF